MLRGALRHCRRAGSLAFRASCECEAGGSPLPSAPRGLSVTSSLLAEVRQDAALSGKAGEGAASQAFAFRPATAGPAAPPGAEVLGPDVRSVPVNELSPDGFSTVCDMYMGRLWTQMERALREAEGENAGSIECEIKPEHGALRVLLPLDGRMLIRKDLEGRALVVESNLFEPWEDKDCMEFRPLDEKQWENEDGEKLGQFLAQALTRYLKCPVCIERPS